MTQPIKAFWEPISIIALLLLILLVSICHLQGWLKRGSSAEAESGAVPPERTSTREKSPKVPTQTPDEEPQTPSTAAPEPKEQRSAGSTPIPTPKLAPEEKTRVMTEEETTEHVPRYRQTIETPAGDIQVNLNGVGLGEVRMNDLRSETAPPSPASSTGSYFESVPRSGSTDDSFHSFMPRRRGGDSDTDDSDSDPGPPPGGVPPAQGPPSGPSAADQGVPGGYPFRSSMRGCS